jgi:Rieske Fe-S protein
MKESKHSRRNFIKSTIVALAIGVIVLWDKMVKTDAKIDSKGEVSLIFDANKKVSFQDDFIVVNNNNDLSVLSSRCTHLGCKINEFKDGLFLCPCHGSTFNLDGTAIKGPAYKPLQKMKFEVDNLSGKIVVIT